MSHHVLILICGLFWVTFGVCSFFSFKNLNSIVCFEMKKWFRLGFKLNDQIVLCFRSKSGVVMINKENRKKNDQYFFMVSLTSKQSKAKQSELDLNYHSLCRLTLVSTHINGHGYEVKPLSSEWKLIMKNYDHFDFWNRHDKKKRSFRIWAHFC